jgi:regulator of protease activity HflC (stomatin/prohibitin superfamily)
VIPLDVWIGCKTPEHLFLNVHVSLQYGVDPNQVVQAMYNLTDTPAQIYACVQDVVSLEVANPRGAYRKGKDAMVAKIQDSLEKFLRPNGWMVHKVLIQNFFIQDKGVSEATKYLAQQQHVRQSTIHSAETEKVQVVKAAEGAKERMRLEGEGTGRQFAAVVSGLKQDLANDDEHPSPDDVSDILLITQYYGTMKAMAKGNSKHTVFMTHGIGAVAEAGQFLCKSGRDTLTSTPVQEVMASSKPAEGRGIIASIFGRGTGT